MWWLQFAIKGRGAQESFAKARFYHSVQRADILVYKHISSSSPSLCPRAVVADWVPPTPPSHLSCSQLQAPISPICSCQQVLEGGGKRRVNRVLAQQRGSPATAWWHCLYLYFLPLQDSRAKTENHSRQKLDSPVSVTTLMIFSVLSLSPWLSTQTAERPLCHI